jgi:hypothetical protein
MYEAREKRDIWTTMTIVMAAMIGLSVVASLIQQCSSGKIGLHSITYGSSGGYTGSWRSTINTDHFYHAIGWDVFNFIEFTLETREMSDNVHEELRLFKGSAPLVIPLIIRDKRGKKLNAGIYDSKHGHMICYWAKSARIDSFVRIEGDRLYWGLFKNAATIRISNRYNLEWEEIDDGVKVLWIPYERSDD